MIRRFKIIFVFFICVLHNAAAAPLDSLVSANHAARLRSSDSLIMETQLRNPAPILMPENNELRQFVSGIRSDINPNMIVEALYLYKKPVNFHSSSSNWDSRQKTAVFNQIVALGSLTGIQYFSASRGAMRTFYEYSSVIDEPRAKNPLPDPVYTQPPQTLTLYARQRDLTFGDNIYRYDYVNTGQSVFFVQENITALTYSIIPAIGRGNLRSVIAVFDCGDSILIYAISMAKAVSLPGMGDRISNSFSSRAEAVLLWLTGRLDREIYPQ